VSTTAPAQAEERALLRSNPSAVLGAKCEGRAAPCLPGSFFWSFAVGMTRQTSGSGAEPQSLTPRGSARSAALKSGADKRCDSSSPFPESAQRVNTNANERRPAIRRLGGCGEWSEEPCESHTLATRPLSRFPFRPRGMSRLSCCRQRGAPRVPVCR